MEIIIYKYAIQFLGMSVMMLFVGGMQLHHIKRWWHYDSRWTKVYSFLAAFACLSFTVFFGYIAYRWQIANGVFTEKPHWLIILTEQELDDLKISFTIACIITLVIFAIAVKYSRR